MIKAACQLESTKMHLTTIAMATLIFWIRHLYLGLPYLHRHLLLDNLDYLVTMTRLLKLQHLVRLTLLPMTRNQIIDLKTISSKQKAMFFLAVYFLIYDTTMSSFFFSTADLTAADCIVFG